MIDFRYHLVSIVSIFLALAVGIVLGAGPLQERPRRDAEQPGATLRKEKDVLRSQLELAKAQVDARTSSSRRWRPALTESRLGGRSAVVVTLPGADASR